MSTPAAQEAPMDRILDIPTLLVLAETVQAITEGQKVTLAPSGDRTWIAGTLRHLTAGPGTSAYFTGGDVRDASVRITTLLGMETWVPLVDLAQAVRNGEAILGRALPAPLPA